ncbi:YcnI family protein [Streptomyces sp. NBC_00102]|uniref:YcnI family copper-binding membrane protein n=1 Tax=Streptomyces sp. NBC_00102 TaxID=2975652 RepID=UPI00224DBFDA|nr:YcnI family protein [Streptomyces sp. NBC_00102]MCX5398200.1 YcnI family protein [Streptomyces sp. NBC_00102]
MNVSRIAVAGGIAATTVLLLAGPASAHVGVQPVGAAAKGGYATINFKVPNERDNASTVKLEVNFPTDHPLSSVSPQAVPGWKIDVTKATLAKPLDVHGKKVTEAVSKVTWTADASSAIKPGYFQQFPLSVGQLPDDTDQLVFKALQTYSNKEVVRWIEETPASGEEPENPAPVLTLTDAAADAHGTAASAPASTDGKSTDSDASGHTTEAASDSGSASDSTARVLGVVGIVIGVAGVAFGVLARRRTV